MSRYTLDASALIYLIVTDHRARDTDAIVTSDDTTGTTFPTVWQTYE